MFPFPVAVRRSPGSSVSGSRVHVLRRGVLRREGKQAQVVVKHVVAHSEAAANRPVAVTRRPCEAQARSKIAILRLRSMEGDQPRNAGRDVQLLRAFSGRHRGKFVADAVVQRYVRRHTPDVVGKAIERRLVAVVEEVPRAALAEGRGADVRQIVVQRRIFVVAANPLRKALRRDRLASVKPELQCVVALYPGDVVHHLIEVLYRRLWRIRIRPHLDEPKIVEGQVREAVQAWEAEVRRPK